MLRVLLALAGLLSAALAEVAVDSPVVDASAQGFVPFLCKTAKCGHYEGVIDTEDGSIVHRSLILEGRRQRAYFIGSPGSRLVVFKVLESGDLETVATTPASISSDQVSMLIQCFVPGKYVWFVSRDPGSKGFYNVWLARDEHYEECLEPTSEATDSLSAKPFVMAEQADGGWGYVTSGMVTEPNHLAMEDLEVEDSQPTTSNDPLPVAQDKVAIDISGTDLETAMNAMPAGIADLGSLSSRVDDLLVAVGQQEPLKVAMAKDEQTSTEFSKTEAKSLEIGNSEAKFADSIYQLQMPKAEAMAVEMSDSVASSIGMAEADTMQMGMAEPNAMTMGMTEADTMQMGMAEPNAMSMGMTEADTMQMGMAEADTMTMGMTEADTMQMGVAEADTMQMGMTEADTMQMGMAEADTMQMGMAEADNMQMGMAEADNMQMGMAEADTITMPTTPDSAEPMQMPSGGNIATAVLDNMEIPSVEGVPIADEQPREVLEAASVTVGYADKVAVIDTTHPHTPLPPPRQIPEHGISQAPGSMHNHQLFPPGLLPVKHMWLDPYLFEAMDQEEPGYDLYGLLSEIQVDQLLGTEFAVNQDIATPVDVVNEISPLGTNELLGEDLLSIQVADVLEGVDAGLSDQVYIDWPSQDLVEIVEVAAPAEDTVVEETFEVPAESVVTEASAASEGSQLSQDIHITATVTADQDKYHRLTIVIIVTAAICLLLLVLASVVFCLWAGRGYRRRRNFDTAHDLPKAPKPKKAGKANRGSGTLVIGSMDLAPAWCHTPKMKRKADVDAITGLSQTVGIDDLSDEQDVPIVYKPPPSMQVKAADSPPAYPASASDSVQATRLEMPGSAKEMSRSSRNQKPKIVATDDANDWDNVDLEGQVHRRASLGN